MQNCPDGRHSNSRLHVGIPTFSVSHTGTLFSALYYSITCSFCQRKTTKNDCYFLYKFGCFLQDVVFCRKMGNKMYYLGRFGENFQTRPRCPENKRLLRSKNQPVILSEVEISPSEERGEIASRKAKRDLVQNFGVLPTECNIDSKSHPNSFGDPFVAIAPRFLLAIRSEEFRLRSG